ncbi:hypothetical protein ACFQGE_18170 [Halomicroarcula sp. GCM10025817]|uniref:hypothetical protein n=1 Tax=Haloarcula TaxID=2237 RepID=UPI0023E8E226|nr:hypothetical protein [Halomicroarcula sp. SYNS111]
MSSSSTGLARNAERGIRVTLVAIFFVGVRRRNWSAAVNAVLSLAGTFLPRAIESRYDVEFLPWQRLYTGSAMVTHAVGMLGPYDDVWWWDHLTHTHSATLVGSLVHVVTRRRGNDPTATVLGAVGLTGIAWELAEYVIHSAAEALDIEPMLRTYGRTDTLFDLCFNLVGALVVIAVGDEYLENFVDRDEGTQDGR